MQIQHEKRGKYLLIKVIGRLDVNWADHFADTCLTHIRHGHHHMILETSGLVFLSSAGIRALMRIYKELIPLQGRFQIVNATTFVRKTLETSGLKMWLVDALPEDLPDSETTQVADMVQIDQVFVLQDKAGLRLEVPANWKPWQKFDREGMKKISLPKSSFALGIGSAAEQEHEAKDLLGDFLALGGNVVYQPPDEDARPDYLLMEKDYIPQLFTIQALLCTGQMSHLIRFAANEQKANFSIPELAWMVLNHTRSKAAGFVVFGEIDGLVGATLTQSPGHLSQDHCMTFPDIRNWISFCGERSYPNKQAALFGIAVKQDHFAFSSLFSLSDNNLYTHVHAAVFPYQPLQNGEIAIEATIHKFFHGPPPLALMHLVNDTRAFIGLGESSLLRGACWCAAIENPEVLL